MRAWLLGFAAAVCAIVGACGGDDGDDPVDPVVFRVTDSLPSDGADSVPLQQEINVFFNRAVDPDTLDRDSFQVIAETGDVILGERRLATLSPTLVRFLPRTGYLPFAVHTVRVLTSLRDTDGNALDEETEILFETEALGPVLPGQQDVEDLGDLLRTGRWFHGMTPLLDGRFLIAGGYQQANSVTDRAEILDPVLKQSTLTAGTMVLGRAAHSQVALLDGRVLLAGGETSDTPFLPTTSCEIFDPATGQFTAVDDLNVSRSLAHATRLADGRVLVTGGQSVNATLGFHFRDDAELYDPTSNQWTLLSSTMARARSGHFSWLDATGDVIVNGGTSGIPSGERWNPGSEAFSDPGSNAPFSHHFAAATALPGGRALLVGGLDTKHATLWNPTLGFLSVSNEILAERSFATATPFVDGRVLIVGGLDTMALPTLIHGTVDLFYPVGSTGRMLRVPDLSLPVPTSHHAAARGPDGAIWITGGLPNDTTTDPARRQVTVIAPGD